MVELHGWLSIRETYEDVEHYSEFQIYVFKKGDCIYKIDKDFSPCIPTIESGTITD